MLPDPFVVALNIVAIVAGCFLGVVLGLAGWWYVRESQGIWKEYEREHRKG